MPDAYPPPPKRIGGWLILVVIQLIDSLLNMTRVLVTNHWPLFRDGNWQREPFIIFEIAGNFLTLTLALVTLSFLVRRSRHTPKLAIACSTCIAAFYVVHYFAAKLILGFALPIEPVVLSLIDAAIWIPYFLVSKRIRATFGEFRHNPRGGERADTALSHDPDARRRSRWPARWSRTMRKATGVGYLTAALLLGLPAVGLIFYPEVLRLKLDLGTLIHVNAVGFFSLYGVRLLARRGYRSLQPSAEEILRDDRRSPVLYLRSFLDDSIEHRPGSNFNPIAHFALRMEEHFFILNRLGPLVAIGRPGESLPETGAYRLYVDDDQWKSRVAELMSRCRLAIIVGRVTTQGVLWEISQALTILRYDQLVFFFPAQRGEDREQQYKAFKESVQGYLPVELPDVLAGNYFLRFQEGWNPELVGAQTLFQSLAIHKCLVKIVQGLEPGFQKPPFWYMPKPALYMSSVALVVALICGLWLASL